MKKALNTLTKCDKRPTKSLSIQPLRGRSTVQDERPAGSKLERSIAAHS